MVVRPNDGSIVRTVLDRVDAPAQNTAWYSNTNPDHPVMLFSYSDVSRRPGAAKLLLSEQHTDKQTDRQTRENHGENQHQRNKS